MPNKMPLLYKLKQRKLVQWALAYAAAAWVSLQVLGLASDSYGFPALVMQLAFGIAALGFLVTLVLAWYHGERGAQKITGTELVILTVLLVIGGGVLLYVGHRATVLPPSKVAASAPIKFPSNSIAVLPFTNLSADKNQDYFSDGISEDLLNLLAKIPQLQVTARTSSFSFKGKGLAIPDIAKKLHVAHILEGSVQKAGNEVRITVQLVDTATDTQLWSQTWDRKLDDIFKIQDEVAEDVVKAMQVKLLGAAPKAFTTDPKAYALYLQAKELGRQFTKEAFAKSDALYRQVLAIDPRYAPAWYELASNFTNEIGIGALPNREGFARAREAAEKALAIDPGYAPAYAELGWLAKENNNLAGAARQFGHALALAPTDIAALGDAALLLKSLDRLDEALVLQEALIRRNPVDAVALYNLGITQRNTGRIDAAIASFHTVLGLSPGRGAAHYELGVALLLKHEPKAALAEVEQEKSDVWRMIGLPLAYCGLGRKTDADRAITALIGKYARDWSYNIAYDYAYCGEANQAFAWLDKAVQYQDPGLHEIAVENLFDKIHSDPRWLPFLRKIGKAPEQLAKIQFTVSLPKAWQHDADETFAPAGGSDHD